MHLRKEAFVKYADLWLRVHITQLHGSLFCIKAEMPGFVYIAVD